MLKNLSKEQKYLLVILALVNFFNYVDRQVVFPLFHSIKMEFNVSDFQLGLLGTVFMLVHSLASLPLGILADKYSRKTIIALSVGFWSITSFASGLAGSFKSLLGIRSLVGIGEAGYAPAATSMISDSFPESVRAQAQGFFNIGMFAGGTLGVILGGIIAYFLSSWRWAFFLVSVPGFILAYLSNKIKETPNIKTEKRESFLKLFKNPAFVWILVSGTFLTFASGAAVSWGVEFTLRYKGYNLLNSSLMLGLTFLVAGSLGVLTGGKIADYFHAKSNLGRSMVIAVSLILGAPFLYLGLATNDSGVFFITYFFIGTFLMSVYHGPVTAVLHEVVPKNMRATAFALYLLVIHILGDTPAPAVIGVISDRSSLRFGLELNAILVLLSGLAFLVVAMLIKKHSVAIQPDGLDAIMDVG